MKKHIKIMCALLSCCLIIFGCACPHAEAVAGVDDLIIGGAAVMTVGLVGILGMLSINAAGFSDALYSAASAVNQDVRELASALFASYARSQNITAGQAVQIAAQGTQYLQDGSIIFNDKMSELMNNYIDWAWSADGGNLIQYADIAVDSGVGSLTRENAILKPTNVNYPVSYYLTNSFTVGDGTFSSNKDVFVSLFIRSNSTSGTWYTYILRCSSESFTANNLRCESYTYQGKTVYYFVTTYSTRNKTTSLPSYNVLPGTSMYPEQTAYDIVFGGQYNSEPVYDVNLDVLDGLITDGDVNILDPSGFISVSDAPVGGGTIKIEDWLSALADVSVGLTASIPVEAEGVITEAVGELAGTSDIAVTQDVVQSGSIDVADSTSVSGLDEFALDLTDFFPFCIPFDIYDMLSMFAASREAPSFDYRFYIPNICDETITIDLSAFDAVATVLRRVELVAFAIGLAFVTKKLIQGGD